MKEIATHGLGTFVNEIDKRGLAIVDLITTYITGVQAYYGFRPIGANDLTFPCVFVDPTVVDVPMVSTGKTTMKFTFDLYFYVIDNNPADVVTLCSSLAWELIKLFSNNALGDVGSGNTNQFKNYSGYWIYADTKSVQLSRTMANPVANPTGDFIRAGVMRLELEDVAVI